MYFYLGCLIVQLMKINLQLAIVGVCYSYCLIILRSSFSSLNVTQETQCLGLEEQHVVIQVDSQLSENIKQRFLTCMNELKKNNTKISKMLLQKVKGNYKLFVTDHNFIIDAILPETINNLHETAKLMFDAGFERECYEIYNSYREEWLEDLLINKLLALRKMGFQDYVIGRWIKTSKVALKILFPSERHLYNRVFSESNSASSNLYFSRICSGAMFQLLNFSVAFANRSPSAWRLFKILNLFETLCDLIHDFESLFLDRLVSEAIQVKNRLGQKSRDIFMEFGNLIFLTPDVELDCWADGGVHPMTCEATGYIVMAFWSRQHLEKVLHEYPFVFDGVKTYSLFYSQMELIMEQFEKKLEFKSQIYEEPALRYFFMMNNLSHIEYRLESFWDHKYLHKNTGQYFELYCRNSWSKVIDFLKMDVNESVTCNIEANSMKDNLSLFNQKFKETCGIQCTWRVFDEKLWNQIKTFLKMKLLPAYENFIAMFENVVGKNADEYIVYGMSDIQDELNHLFLLEEVDCVRHDLMKTS
ncbi:unnamed protein product [Trifolium pratense]|nr:unnamed protein product [Trifolium pratense]